MRATGWAPHAGYIRQWHLDGKSCEEIVNLLAKDRGLDVK